MSDPMTPDQIRALATAAGGQCELARKINANPRTVRRWIAGDSCPSWYYKAAMRRVKVPH